MAERLSKLAAAIGFLGISSIASAADSYIQKEALEYRFKLKDFDLRASPVKDDSPLRVEAQEASQPQVLKARQLIGNEVESSSQEQSSGASELQRQQQSVAITAGIQVLR